MAAGGNKHRSGGYQISWPFGAECALLSRRLGRHTLSVRYDRLHVEVRDAAECRSGRAWTAAYLFDATARWRISVEWLQVESDSYNREDLYGGSQWSTQTQVQLSVRYALRSAIR